MVRILLERPEFQYYCAAYCLGKGCRSNQLKQDLLAYNLKIFFETLSNVYTNIFSL